MFHRLAGPGLAPIAGWGRGSHTLEDPEHYARSSNQPKQSAEAARSEGPLPVWLTEGDGLPQAPGQSVLRLVGRCHWQAPGCEADTSPRSNFGRPNFEQKCGPLCRHLLRIWAMALRWRSMAWRAVRSTCSRGTAAAGPFRSRAGVVGCDWLRRRGVGSRIGGGSQCGCGLLVVEAVQQVGEVAQGGPLLHPGPGPFEPPDQLGVADEGLVEFARRRLCGHEPDRGDTVEEGRSASFAEADGFLIVALRLSPVACGLLDLTGGVMVARPAGGVGCVTAVGVVGTGVVEAPGVGAGVAGVRPQCLGREGQGSRRARRREAARPPRRRRRTRRAAPRTGGRR